MEKENRKMKNWTSKTTLGLIWVLLLGGFTSGAFALQEKKQKQKKQKPTIYEATMVGIRGAVGARSIPVSIRITGHTSDDEVKEYLALISEGGDRGYSGPLRKRLEKVKGLGRIAPSGFLGTDLAVVREKDTDHGRLVTLVTARNLTFGELYASSRSTDYPFSFVQLLVDEEGKGQGTVILAARAKFTEDGHLDIESYGIQPFQLFNVRRRH